MSVLLQKTWQGCNILFYDWIDVRTRDVWPGPITLASILLIYLEFCANIGPRLMKNRKPFVLKNTMMVYNVIQIIVNSYLLYEGLMSGWLRDYNYLCQPFDETVNANSLRMMKAVQWYTYLKLAELLDTVFFVLRKKNRQISSLHLYHHFIMPIVSWMSLKYYSNGHSTLLGVINVFVHIVMYSYYLIAGLGPKYQKYLWWKKHVTTLQLVQFLIVFIHNFIPLFTDCNYPKWINALLSIHSWHFIYMFGQFYYINYMKNKLKNKEIAKANATAKSEN